MAEEINTNLDTTPLPPNNLVAQDPQSKELAGYVRTKTFGREVRESIARSIELNSTRSKNAENVASETVNVANDLTDRFNQQIGALTEDSEVIDARGGKATLGQRLDETDAQLEQFENRIDLAVKEDTGYPNVLHIETRDNSKQRALEIHNITGRLGVGTAKESFVIHHYGDNNMVQWDNVGQDNNMLVLKQGYNPSMSGHNKVGSGKFIQFDRDGRDLPEPIIVEHLGSISAEDWWDVGMLAAEHTWGLTLVGKRNSANKVQTVLPLLIYSKGINADYKGADALRIHSTDYGGTGLRLSNRPTSYGSLLHLDSYSNDVGQPALTINQRGANSGLIIHNNGQTVPMFRFSRSNAAHGDLITATNESGATIFRIEGDGLAIHLKDSATGELKRLAISNGQVVVQ